MNTQYTYDLMMMKEGAQEFFPGNYSFEIPVRYLSTVLEK